MRYFTGPGYGILLNFLPLIFLSLNDIFFGPAVEAAYSLSHYQSKDTNYYLENGTLAALGGEAPQLPIAVIPKSESSITRNSNKILIGAVVVLILATIVPLVAKQAIKAHEYRQFESNLAKLKALAKELRAEVLQINFLYMEKTDPESNQVELDTLNANAVHKYLNEFLKNTDSTEKTIKLEIWSNYLYPFLKQCDLLAKRQSGRAIILLQNKLSELGYGDEAFLNYDTNTSEIPIINNAALSNLLSDMESQNKPRKEINKVKYFANNCTRFFTIRKEYMTLKESVFNALKKKHADVKRLGAEFAKSKGIE